MSKPIVYFGPHREPAVLVEDFGELRPGMLVWYSDCWTCHGSHRYFLLRLLRDGEAIDAEGRDDGGWIAMPGSPCERTRLSPSDKLLPAAVARGVVYAVILEPPANTETRGTSKPRELEKV